MPIFNKLLHSSVRNKLALNIINKLLETSIESKYSEYVNYIPIKYKNSNITQFICSIKNATVFSDWGFIFMEKGNLIKDNLCFDDIICNYAPQITGRFLFYKFRGKIRLDGNAFVLKSQHQDCYGHWIHDTISRLFLLRDSGFFNYIDAFIIAEDSKTKFHKESLELFVVKNIINVPDEKKVECEHLFFSSFPCLAPSKPFKWECDKFLELTKSIICNYNINFYDKIYVSRRRVKKRNIINEEDLIYILEQLDYKVIYPEDYSVAEQFCIFNRAKKIISVLGSGLTNIVCCEPKTSILGIVASVRYEDWHKYICNVIGMQYFEYIEDNPKNIHYFYNIKDYDRFDFILDLEKFKKILEKFDKY